MTPFDTKLANCTW